MSIPPVIIIFEPDPLIKGVLRVEFSRWDFAVLVAGNTDEAEDFACQTVASMVVLDACRNRLAAFEACARIRHTPGYADRPIVLTTQEISDQTAAAGEEAGATVLLVKPYSMHNLFQAVLPRLPANDPLAEAGYAKPGVAAPVAHEWTTEGFKQWQPPDASALTRNRMLLPIVRGVGKKIPVYRMS